MQPESSIPFRLHETIDRELESGERIRWMEMPTPRYFTGASTGAFLFAIPWTGFAVFWTAWAAWGTSQVEGGPGLFSLFPLFGVPFILIGVGMLSAPLWAYRKARRTVYIITDRRAVSIEGGRSTTIRSYTPRMLQDVHRRENRDGSGDVIIARRAWCDSDSDRQSAEQGFLRVRNAMEVEHMLMELAGRSD